MSVGSLAALFAGLLSGCALEPDGDASPDQEAPSSVTEHALLDGTYDPTLRPEIGLLGIGGGCTGTLVDPRIVLTAAHCVRYTSGNVTGTFTITRSNGTTVVYPVDKRFSLGPGDPADLNSGLGATDVALVRLATPVAPADATPTYIWPWWPGAGTAETIFGYGCQDRSAKTGGGMKQHIDATAGVTTYQLCPGDSGGPAVWYGPTAGGPVFAVNSGYNWLGQDFFGDAATHGVPGLEAVRRFGDAVTTNLGNATFASLAAQSGVRALAGDFNGDSLTDLALAGGAGWSAIYVAFSNGDGTFRITGSTVSSFAGWAQEAPQIVAGDFNADGRADLALAGRSGWNTIPIAFSLGDGSFSVTNFANSTFASWAQHPGAQLVAGNFDGAGGDDLALAGGSTWSTIPVALSNNNGTFSLVNAPSSTFAGWAQVSGARVVAGDFNGDLRADLALTGPGGWSTIPVAFSNWNGTFSIANQSVAQFPGWASRGGKIVAGDFDGDGRTDLAVTGVSGWVTVAFALSTGGGNFTAASLPMSDFPAWAVSARFVLPGRFKPHTAGGDGKRDLALLGAAGWSTIPVASLRN